MSNPERGSLEELFLNLASQGCHPCISRRGKQWRAHINAAGNFWSDRRTPLAALRAAERSWIAARKPLDGMAEVSS